MTTKAAHQKKLFKEERRRAQWEAWRAEYRGMSDGAIVDILVERFGLCEATRYRLYHEARKYRVKIFAHSANLRSETELRLLV